MVKSLTLKPLTPISPLCAHTLDHNLLNDIDGLDSPTLENICLWLWTQLEAELPQISAVEVFRDSLGQSCLYHLAGRYLTAFDKTNSDLLTGCILFTNRCDYIFAVKPACPPRPIFNGAGDNVRQNHGKCIIRFAVPEFTSICPVTGQPDFAHLVIDYVPDAYLVESKDFFKAEL